MVSNYGVRRSKRLQHKHRNRNSNNKNSNSVLLELPEEVFTDEILIRLPAKQLARMRCVSKALYAILSQPRFVKSHLHRNNTKDNETLLVINPDSLLTKRVVEVTAHPSRSPNIQLNDLIKLPPDFPRSKFEWRVLGSVHGLICFKCGFDYQCFSIYIWNPSLSAVMRLPRFTSPSTRHEDRRFTFQFGFDPKSDDYKVVKLMNHCVPDMQVEVYSMRKGTWEFISSEESCFPSNNVLPFQSANQAVAGGGRDGHVYWLCYTDRDHHAILAFDLGNETFHEISLPDSICRSKGTDKILGFFDGKLCVTSYRFAIGVEFETWVMNERGVAESWVKHSVLSHFTCTIDPMGFTLNNEFLLSGKNYDPLALYDPATTKVKYFEGCHFYPKTNIVWYVDSLVWITPAKKHANTSCVASDLG